MTTMLNAPPPPPPPTHPKTNAKIPNFNISQFRAKNLPKLQNLKFPNSFNNFGGDSIPEFCGVNLVCTFRKRYRLKLLLPYGPMLTKTKKKKGKKFFCYINYHCLNGSAPRYLTYINPHVTFARAGMCWNLHAFNKFNVTCSKGLWGDLRLAFSNHHWRHIYFHISYNIVMRHEHNCCGMAQYKSNDWLIE